MKAEELREIAATALAQIVREHGTTDGTYIQLGSKTLLTHLEAMAVEVERRTRQECAEKFRKYGTHLIECKLPPYGARSKYFDKDCTCGFAAAIREGM